MEVGCIQCSMLGQLNDPGHLLMNRDCVRLPALSSLIHHMVITINVQPSLEGKKKLPSQSDATRLTRGIAERLASKLKCNPDVRLHPLERPPYD